MYQQKQEQNPFERKRHNPDDPVGGMGGGNRFTSH